MTFGRKTGGKAQGGKNRATIAFDEALKETGLDPEQLMVRYAQDRVPCGLCDENYMVPRVTALIIQGITSQRAIQQAEEMGGMTTCTKCAGTGFRMLADGEPLKALTRIIDSRVSKLSTITVQGNEDADPVFISLNHEADSARARVIRKLMAYYEARQQALADGTALPDFDLPALDHEPAERE